MSHSVSSPLPSILFIDDDADVQKAAALLLPRRGYRLLSARAPEEAWSVLASEPVEVVLLDLNFRPGAISGAEGLQTLAALLAHDPDAVVVVVTGHSGIGIAVAAMRAGAADFVMKPWSNDRLVATLADAVALRRRRRAGAARARRDDAADTPTPIVAESEAMRRVLQLMRRAAGTDAPVLLQGEAGTGKSLLGQTLHRLSPRAARPLVVLDAALHPVGDPEPLGTLLDQAGADGTLLLDEPGQLPMPTQAWLLARLQQRPGLRLVACSRLPRDRLASALQADLLRSLAVVELALPPLRARGADLGLLAQHFLRLFGHRHGRPGLVLAPDALAAIEADPWPGNVRALSQAMERVVVLADGPELHARDIPLEPRLEDGTGVTTGDPGGSSGDLNLARSEKAIVAAALRRHGFNVSHAARELGLTRATLYRRMARHGL